MIKLRIDHQAHILGTFGLVLAIALFLPPTESVVAALIIAALKELIWDWLLKRGTPEWADMAANVFGATCAHFLLYLSTNHGVLHA